MGNSWQKSRIDIDKAAPEIAMRLEVTKHEDAPSFRLIAMMNTLQGFPEIFDAADLRQAEFSTLNNAALGVTAGSYLVGIWSIARARKMGVYIPNSKALLILLLPFSILIMFKAVFVPTYRSQLVQKLQKRYAQRLPNEKLYAYQFAIYSQIFAPRQSLAPRRNITSK